MGIFENPTNLVYNKVVFAEEGMGIAYIKLREFTWRGFLRIIE